MNTKTPICRTFVVKIASRCNLNCTYCYMYNMGDESYKQQPKFMLKNTYSKMFIQAKEHCVDNQIEKFTFVIHGGEPLLFGKKRFSEFITCGRDVFKGTKIKIAFVIQTNALLIDSEWCDLLLKHRVSVGISLDGLKKDNDKNRIDHQGRGSYDSIIKGIKLLQNWDEKLNPGILSFININSDPTEIYNHFKSLGVEFVDFLIPEATYHQLPPSPEYGKFTNSETPYGDWLIEMFDNWFYDNSKSKFRIRRFSQYIHSILGGDINGDDMGNLYNEVLVIETNGAFEAVDALKACGDKFTKTNATVENASIEEAMETELAKQYYLSHINLPKKCLACPIRETCGGGYIPHRYSHSKGFNNPSIYCNDLLKLITHIQNRVIDTLPEDLILNSNLEKLSFSDAINLINKEISHINIPDYETDLERFKSSY